MREDGGQVAGPREACISATQQPGQRKEYQELPGLSEWIVMYRG